jgi:integrase
MAVREVDGRYYVYFTWKKHRIETVTSAKTLAEAKRIEKDARSAFRVYRFDNLDQLALEFVTKTFENKGWPLPLELARPEPEEELTLIVAIKEYLRADAKHRAERNLYAITRIVEHFGERCPLKSIRVPQIRAYQRQREKKVANATVNRELAVLSGVMRMQVEQETLDFNPCTLAKRLPAHQRDSYLSWEDFNRLLEHSWWSHDILVTLYYSGMRFNEVVNLRWEMYKPERRMLILPPDMTKEGKNPNSGRLRAKRVPLRREVIDLLDARRRSGGEKVVKATGLIFGYEGRFKDSGNTYHGKPIDRSMVRKVWDRAVRLAGLSGLQFRDFRHTWKTNAQRSGMDPSVRNLIVGHSSTRSVEDRYIRVSDQELLRAVDSMTFDHGWTELDLVEEG